MHPVSSNVPIKYNYPPDIGSGLDRRLSGPIWRTIINFLPTKTIASMARVSKTIQNHSSHDLIWSVQRTRYYSDKNKPDGTSNRSFVHEQEKRLRRFQQCRKDIPVPTTTKIPCEHPILNMDHFAGDYRFIYRNGTVGTLTSPNSVEKEGLPHRHLTSAEICGSNFAFLDNNTLLVNDTSFQVEGISKIKFVSETRLLVGALGQIQVYEIDMAGPKLQLTLPLATRHYPYFDGTNTFMVVCEKIPTFSGFDEITGFSVWDISRSNRTEAHRIRSIQVKGIQRPKQLVCTSTHLAVHSQTLYIL